MYYHSRAITIKTMDFRETDKLITIFSEKEGKVRAVAKGIKKPKSSLRACVQPFCHSSFFLSAGRGLDLVTQAKLIDFYGVIREDLKKTLYAVYLMELLDKSLMERAALPELYSTTLTVLKHLNDYDTNLLIIRFFEMNLLKNLGYNPILTRCVICGAKDIRLPSFSVNEGGAVCANCSAQLNQKYPLSAESLALIRLLANGKITTVSRVKTSPTTLRQIENFTERFLEYYIEKGFNLKSIIAKISGY